MRFAPDKTCGTLTPAERAERQRISGIEQALDAMASGPPIPLDGTCTRAPGLWFSRSPYERAAAADMCRTVCPYLSACRSLANASGPTEGVWAGVDLDAIPHRLNPFTTPTGNPVGNPEGTDHARHP